MAKRKSNIHPSLRRQEPDDIQFVGGPGDDDDLLGRIDEEIDEMEDEDDEEDELEERPATRRKRDPRDDEIADLRRRIEHLSTAIPPAAPRQVEPETDPLDDVDWDAEMFTDPKAALKKYRKMVSDEIKKEMRNEYQQDQSSKSFWKDFYEQHSDLKDDHDLVEATMAKNMHKLANMPVAEAYDELADLTRQRISRYSQRGQQPRRRAVTEGATEVPSGRRAPRQSDKPEIRTLSDLINARRTKRLTRRSTAA